MLDQTDLVPAILDAERTRKPVPPLGPFKTFQVPVRDIADLTGLTMPALLDADILQPAAAARVDRWIPLTTMSDITLPTTPA